jgi:hypothetical protein
MGDSGRHCPRCLYNLTGVAARECPECGTNLRPRPDTRERPPAHHWLFYVIALSALVVVMLLALGVLFT